MVSTDKLIKVGVKYSDSYFETLKNIYNNAYRNNESLEEFLNDTQDYSIGNPLEAGGFKDTLTNLIASSTNDIRFSRPAQKALMNTIIRNTTGELIVDVGNDVKQSVRDIVAKGYNTRTLSRQNVADEISSTLDGINRKRARTIARTEIKRAQTTSNYIVALERGANAYKYKCGAKPCDICKVDCGKTYPITDLEHLPPRHPNCMCSVSFFKDPNLPPVETQKLDSINDSTNESPSNAPKVKSNNNLLKGTPKEYMDVDDEGHAVKVYKYDNIELAFNENTRISHEELKRHIDSLPQVFEQTQAKRIYIHDYANSTCGGMWWSDKKTLHVYDSRKSVEGLYQVFNHEFAHSLDMFWINESPKAKYSDPKIYQRIFEADNKLGYSDLGIIQPEVPIKWVTNYAGRSYLKYMKNSFEEGGKWAKNKLFTEDFAEASAYYLNPNQHAQFVKDFPNRAKYLESIYGKPDFTNSGIKVMSELSPEQLKLYNKDIEFESITKRDVRELYERGINLQRELIDKQRGELQEEIERLTEERKKVRRTRRECETEECYDKITLKVSEMKIQIKRLEKVGDELFTKWSKTFDEMSKMESIFS